MKDIDSLNAVKRFDPSGEPHRSGDIREGQIWPIVEHPCNA